MAPARKAPAKRAPSKKAPARKTPAKKAPAKNATAPQAAAEEPASSRPRKSRVEDLREDYDQLGALLLVEMDGAKAAALSRERRQLGELLEALESPAEVSVVDELAARRRPGPTASGSAGRRKSR